METVTEWVEGLRDRDNQHAYECLKHLLSLCEHANDAYAYFDTFADMMRSDHSYIRTRGVLMVAACARWDEDNKLDEVLDEYLKHVEDVKPISARQCIQTLPNIARYKPDLAQDMIDALHRVNVLRYPITMQSLLNQDVANALHMLIPIAEQEGKAGQ